MKPLLLSACLTAVFTLSLHAVTPEGKQKLVLIAGKPSHPAGMHEFRAGTILLEKCLKAIPNLVVDRHDMGWVSDEKTFAEADAIVIYADGGGKHPAVVDGHLDILRPLIAKGVGFGCMHYGVEIVPDQAGKEFQAWLGGHYENAYSCNPIWDASYTELPQHAITRGVQPFTTKDEWYFHMRFRPAFGHGIKTAEDTTAKFAPILVATPPDATRDGPYVYPKGPYPHIQAEKGSPETMMWSIERADGGRAFGFTGGHFHDNWGNDNVRKAVLNALLWVTKIEVPEKGFESTVTADDLKQNLDPKPEPKPKAPEKPKSTSLETPPVFQRVATR